LIEAKISNCQFKEITALADQWRGGSAIYAYFSNGISSDSCGTSGNNLLVIDNNCLFYRCVNNKGNGGAIFAWFKS
jgi:hypothetical protein